MIADTCFDVMRSDDIVEIPQHDSVMVWVITKSPYTFSAGIKPAMKFYVDEFQIPISYLCPLSTSRPTYAKPTYWELHTGKVTDDPVPHTPMKRLK